LASSRAISIDRGGGMSRLPLRVGEGRLGVKLGPGRRYGPSCFVACLVRR